MARDFFNTIRERGGERTIVGADNERDPHLAGLTIAVMKSRRLKSLVPVPRTPP